MMNTTQTNDKHLNVSFKLQFLVFTIVLLIIGTQTGLNISKARERNETETKQNLVVLYNEFKEEIKILEKNAATLSLSFASRPDIQKRFQAKDRQGLLALLEPIFTTLKTDYDIVHLQFHEPTGQIFLRIHAPEQHDDYTFAYRQANALAIISRQTVAGVEIDPNRLGIQGVSPMFHQGQFVGLVEVGLDYDQAFLEDLEARTGADYKMWVTHKDATPAGLGPLAGAPESPSPEFFYYAGTDPTPLPIPAEVYQTVLQNGEAQIHFVSAGDQELAVLVAPMQGYGDRIIGILEISVSRAEALAALQRDQTFTFIVAGVLALLALILMLISTNLVVLRPLKHLTAVAQRQLKGDLTTRAELLPADEFGQLGHTLNVLTETLDNTLKDQEDTIAKRTAQLQEELAERKQVEEALRESEEKFRTFTESAPGAILIYQNYQCVYANPAAERITGYTNEELLSMKFWDVAHLDYKDVIKEGGKAIARGESSPKQYELRIVAKDGSEKWTDGRLALIKYKGKRAALISAVDITERKRAEEALRESEEKYRSVIENANVGILVIQDGQQVFYNSKMYEMLGYTKKAYSKAEFISLVHPEDRSYAVDRIRQRLMGVEMDPDTAEMRVLTKSGDIKWIETNSVAIQWNGRPAVQAFVIDITERKQAEEALRKSEERFRSLSASAPVGIFLTDTEGRCIYANARLQNTAGLTFEESLGYGWNRAIHPDDREAMLEEASKKASEGREFSREFRILTPQGELHWVHGRATVIFSEEGEQIGRVGTIEDITERKKAEEALRESEERYRSLFEGAKDHIFVLDQDFRYVMVNPSALKAGGFTLANIAGKGPRELFPEDADFYISQYRRAFETREPVWFERELRLPDGLHWFSVTLSPIRDAQGRVIALTGISRDITERKQAEGALRQSEEHYRALSELTSDVAYAVRVEPDGTTVPEWVTGALTPITGFTLDELVARGNWPSLMHPDDMPLALEHLQVHLTGQPDVSEYRIITKNGETRWLRDYGHPVWDEAAGRVVRIIGAAQDITERKQAEEALRESEANLREAQKIAHLGSWNLDLTTNVFTTSEEMVRIFKYSKDYIGLDEWTEFIYPDDKEMVETAMKDAISGKKSYDIEFRIVRTDGEIRILHAQGEVIRDESGQPIKMVGTGLDITERKQVEENLRIKDNAIASSINAIAIAEFAGNLTYVNASFLNMWGYDDENEVLGRPTVEFWQAEEKAWEVIEALQDKGSWTGELIAKRKDGSSFDVQVAAGIVTDETGKPICMMSSFADITARKRAEEALRESEETARALLNATGDSALLIDLDGIVLASNERAAKSLRMTVNEFVGRYLFDFFPPDPAKSRKAIFDECIRSGEPFQHEDQLRKTIFDNRLYPVLDSQGNVKRVAVFTRDITKHKQAEEERERLLAKLEVKNRELESFVYTVSHDLKAPLVSLAGFSSALLQQEYHDQLGEKGQHYLERIQANVAYMDALVVHLLDLSRVGRVLGSIEAIDVIALLREVQEGLAVKLEAAGAEFIIQEPLPTIHADRSRIRQVLANLIDNALKFRSAERPLRIEVGGQEERECYHFYVADNGLGIAPQYQEQIFAPFQRLEAETEGVGMGLALVKKIVEHHGGRVWVESESGKGSTFHFTISVKEEDKHEQSNDG